MANFNFEQSADQSGVTPFDVMTSNLLLLLAALFNHLEGLTPDDFYKWFFRALSCISLVLIIYINWNKVKEIIQKKRKKHGKT